MLSLADGSAAPWGSFLSAPSVLTPNSLFSRSSCVPNTFTSTSTSFVDLSAKVIFTVAFLSPVSFVFAGVISSTVASSGRFLKAFL